MESFPKEVWVDVLLNQSVKDILKQCNLNKRVNDVCNSEVFWEYYLFHNYKVRFQDPKIKNKLLAKRAEILLEGSKKYRTIFTVDSFWSIVENLKEPYTDYLSVRPDFFGSYIDISNFRNKYFNVEEFYGLDFPPYQQAPNEILGNLTTLIREPTSYILDKNKTITLRYNQDMVDAIMEKIVDDTSLLSLHEPFSDIVNNIRQIVLDNLIENLSR